MQHHLFHPEKLDLSKTETFDVWDRHNLVRIDNLANPEDPIKPFDSKELRRLASAILEARKNGRPVILFSGAFKKSASAVQICHYNLFNRCREIAVKRICFLRNITDFIIFFKLR